MGPNCFWVGGGLLDGVCDGIILGQSGVETRGAKTRAYVGDVVEHEGQEGEEAGEGHLMVVVSYLGFVR